MKIYFKSQLEGVLWMAQHADGETHFKILREEMDLNHLLTDTYFIHAVTASLTFTAQAA